MRACHLRSTRRSHRTAPSPSSDSLDVLGTIPPGLSGRLLGIGPGRDGVVTSIRLHAGQAGEYRSQQVRTAAAVRNVVVFGDSILVFGDDSPAHELSPDLGTLRRVDLAGQTRDLAAFPKLDPATGDLHLIARADGGTQAHVVVSAGALTRRNRPILDAPNRIRHLALTPRPRRLRGRRLRRRHVTRRPDAAKRGSRPVSAPRVCCTLTMSVTPSSCSPSHHRSSNGRCTPRLGPFTARC